MFGTPQALALTFLLAGQVMVFYGFSGTESVPASRPLKETPLEYGRWKMVSEGVIEKEILDVLKADDVVTRTYAQTGSANLANLFVAYFRSQRTGQAPHSPKNCLPGSGWVPSASEIINIDIPGLSSPIPVNHYIVEREDQKSVVLYWYQTPHRVVASEYKAKIYLVLDSIRYRRSDTALIRVVSPVVDGNEAAATAAAIDFVRSFFLPLREYLPS